ncbi:hypothetical protein ACLB2K_002335 [Fragaria x ananassa]
MIVSFGLWRKMQNSRAWEILSCWVSFALWNIWKEMCTFLYEHRDPNAWGVIESVKYVVAEFSGITDHPPQVGVEEKCKLKDGSDMWSAPLGSNIKINCDGAWDAYSNLAGIGVIARNSSGAVINGCAKSCYSSSALHAEAFAVKEGLILAKSMNATTMCIELDYEQLYNAVVKNSSQISWSIYPLLVDIKRLKIGLLSLLFLKKPHALPFLLSIFLLLTWVSLRLQHSSFLHSPNLSKPLEKNIKDDGKANLVRFGSGFPSQIAKDKRGWLLDPISLAQHYGISGGAVICASVHLGEIRPGGLRGNHRHHSCNETFVIWGAETRFRMRLLLQLVEAELPML